MPRDFASRAVTLATASAVLAHLALVLSTLA
jgi:hypothetical protein